MVFCDRPVFVSSHKIRPCYVRVNFVSILKKSNIKKTHFVFRREQQFNMLTNKRRKSILKPVIKAQEKIERIKKRSGHR